MLWNHCCRWTSQLGSNTTILPLSKIGIANILSALATSSPSFVILGLGIMCAAMVMRGFSKR